LRPETEQRYFAIDSRVFAASSDMVIPEIVRECASRINSKFFSIDEIERRDGCHRIVEVGDGQVSGLVGWTPTRFADLWCEAGMTTKDENCRRFGKINNDDRYGV
jgi:ATP-grasp domain, R2K clade family 3